MANWKVKHGPIRQLNEIFIQKLPLIRLQYRYIVYEYQIFDCKTEHE